MTAVIVGTGMEQESTVRLPGSFEAFYRAEYPAIAALGYSLTGKSHVADDIAQEAFLRAHRDWGEIGRRPHPEYWVRRVAVNLAMSRFRRLRAEARAVTRLGPAQAAYTAPLSAEAETFWAAVRSLGRRQREVVALHYVFDMPVAGIAPTLQIAEGTVKATLHQARQRLEVRLRESGWWE